MSWPYGSAALRKQISNGRDREESREARAARIGIIWAYFEGRNKQPKQVAPATPDARSIREERLTPRTPQTVRDSHQVPAAAQLDATLIYRPSDWGLIETPGLSLTDLFTLRPCRRAILPCEFTIRSAVNCNCRVANEAGRFIGEH